MFIKQNSTDVMEKVFALDQGAYIKLSEYLHWSYSFTKIAKEVYRPTMLISDNEGSALLPIVAAGELDENTILVLCGSFSGRPEHLAVITDPSTTVYLPEKTEAEQKALKLYECSIYPSGSGVRVHIEMPYTLEHDAHRHDVYASVEVRHDRDPKTNEHTAICITKCEVNWSALGSQTPADTRLFAESLLNAAAIADAMKDVLTDLLPFFQAREDAKWAAYVAERTAKDAMKPPLDQQVKAPGTYAKYVGHAIWMWDHGRGVIEDYDSVTKKVVVCFEADGKIELYASTIKDRGLFIKD